MKRFITIAFAALSVLVMASCQPEEIADALTVNASEINFTNDGGSQDVSFTSNVAWTAAADQSWISLDATEGEAGDATIKITVAANTDYATRSGKVTVTAGSVQTVFTVKQSEPIVFEADAPSVISAAQQQIVINVNTNDEYSVSIDESAASWLSVAGTKAAPTASKVTLNVTANNGLQSRTGIVTVKTASNSFVYTITQTSNFTETELASAKYLGMAMKLYDSENDEYLSYDEFFISLKNGDETINIAVNVEAGADATAFPTGEFELCPDTNHAAGKFSVKSEEECYYTGIFNNGEELLIADGTISIAKEGDEYSIAASFMDENENIRQYSYVGKIEGVEDSSLMAVSQGITYTGQYGTYFASKAKSFYFTFTVSRAVNSGDFAVNYVDLTLYTPESTDPTVVPVGKYTLAAGNEVKTIENPIYPSGNYNAQPGSFTWRGNNKEKNEYGNRLYTEIKDGAEVEITCENGQYFISIKATLRSYYNVCEWNSDYECWAWKYDETTGDPIVEYGEWFNYEAKIPFVSTPKIKDTHVELVLDTDYEFKGTNLLNAYQAMWYGDVYGYGGNVFAAYWPSMDNIFTLYVPIHTKSSFTYAATGTNIPYGTYTFTKTLPTENTDYMCNIAKLNRSCVQNSYTGTVSKIDGGSITFTASKVTIDVTATITTCANSEDVGKVLHFTGTLPAASDRIVNHSANNAQKKSMAWATVTQ